MRPRTFGICVETMQELLEAVIPSQIHSRDSGLPSPTSHEPYFELSGLDFSDEDCPSQSQHRENSGLEGDYRGFTASQGLIPLI